MSMTRPLAVLAGLVAVSAAARSAAVRLRRRGHRLPPRRGRAGRRRDDQRRPRSTTSPAATARRSRTQLPGPAARSLPLRYLRGGVAGQLALVRRGRAARRRVRRATPGTQYDQKVAELQERGRRAARGPAAGGHRDRGVHGATSPASSRPSASSCSRRRARPQPEPTDGRSRGPAGVQRSGSTSNDVDDRPAVRRRDRGRPGGPDRHRASPSPLGDTAKQGATADARPGVRRRRCPTAHRCG